MAHERPRLRRGRKKAVLRGGSLGFLRREWNNHAGRGTGGWQCADRDWNLLLRDAFAGRPKQSRKQRNAAPREHQGRWRAPRALTRHGDQAGNVSRLRTPMRRSLVPRHNSSARRHTGGGGHAQRRRFSADERRAGLPIATGSAGHVQAQAVE